MKRIIQKLFLGSNAKNLKPLVSPIRKNIKNIQSIWHNHHQDDSGIEKIIRLYLATSKLLFQGINLKTFDRKKGIE